MSRGCPYCQSGVLSGHRNFQADKRWSCDSCDRVYRKATEEDVNPYNDVRKGDLVLVR